jgi:hypothetical protein
MKRLLKFGGSLLGLLALAALAIALVLNVGGMRKGAEQPASLAFQSPEAAAAPISPVTTRTNAPLAIPRCIFGPTPAPVEAAGPSLDAYVFSKPKVALTSAPQLGIVGWLPDNERLLITQGIPNTNRQAIETFDVQTGEMHIYAEREAIGQKPLWAQTFNGVAYAKITDRRGELWLSQDAPGSAQRYASGLSSMSLAADPNGQRLLYLAEGKRLQELSLTTKVAQSTSIAPSRWEHSVSLQQAPPAMYQMDWRPETSQIALYNDTYFFLVDIKDGQGCEIDLGSGDALRHWAVMARWSPDGRYLAMLTTSGTPPVRFVDLSILDMVTGDLRSMHPEAYINPGQYYVTEVAWAPDSRVVAILAAIEEKEGVQSNGLFLMDAISGRSRRMLPQMVFPGGDAGWNLDWSPNGNYVALTCLNGPLCLIEATKN